MRTAAGFHVSETLRWCQSPNGMQIPEWNVKYATLGDANGSQRTFYAYFVSKLSSGEKVEIGDNLSYLFAYLTELIIEFISNRNIELLKDRFNKIEALHGDCEKIVPLLHVYLVDAYLLLQDYDNAWDSLHKSKTGTISDVIYIRANCSKTFLLGSDLIVALGSRSGLTKFGLGNIEQLKNFATLLLSDYQALNGANYANHFLNGFDYGKLDKTCFDELKEFYVDEKDFNLWVKHYVESQKSNQPYPKYFHHYLFAGLPLPWEPPYIKRSAIPYVLLVALENRLKAIFREAENTVRNERNLPAVGEGWISETELFQKIAKHFAEEKVLHHGRPTWLKPQHLDIYFQEREIAIEYQGIQHQRPVDFFGGEEQFAKQQALDLKKKKLCVENRCKLIYVHENYDFEEVVIQIRDCLK